MHQWQHTIGKPHRWGIGKACAMSLCISSYKRISVHRRFQYLCNHYVHHSVEILAVEPLRVTGERILARDSAYTKEWLGCDFHSVFVIDRHDGPGDHVTSCDGDRVGARGLGKHFPRSCLTVWGKVRENSLAGSAFGNCFGCET